MSVEIAVTSALTSPPAVIGTAAPVEVVPPAEPAAGQIQYRLVKLRKAARVGNHQGEAGDTLALVELMPDVPLNFVVHALYNDLAGEESVETP